MYNEISPVQLKHDELATSLNRSNLSALNGREISGHDALLPDLNVKDAAAYEALQAANDGFNFG
jgi:hypothetical protein